MYHVHVLLQSFISVYHCQDSEGDEEGGRGGGSWVSIPDQHPYGPQHEYLCLADMIVINHRDLFMMTEHIDEILMKSVLDSLL